MKTVTVEIDPYEALGLLELALSPEPGTLGIRDMTKRFPWVRHHRLVFGTIVTDGRTAVVALSREHPPLLLSGENALMALSTLLLRERAEIPGGLTPFQLAELIRHCSQLDYRGVVGEPRLLDAPHNPTRELAGGNQLEQANLRIRCATAPMMEDLGAGHFRLHFYFWTPNGGVEYWVVQGSPQLLSGAHIYEEAPAGSFEWPYS